MRVLLGSITLLLSLACGAQAFVAPKPQGRVLRNSALSVQLPRLDLPDVVTEKLDDYGLKNPNTMTPEEYQNYSGAAILGTLLFFAVPGALVTGLPDEIGSILGAAATDFAVSALIGGGLGIYLSLKDDQVGATVRKYGGALLGKGKDLTGLKTLRYDLPSAATDVLTEQLGLLNPNDMNAEDYDGYSGAAVAGTLVFFLLPGAIVTGAADTAKEFLGSTAIDFALSAIVGGGAFIFLSLRDDEISSTVNSAGSKLLETVDQLLDGEKALPAAKEVPEKKEESVSVVAEKAEM